MQTISRLRKLWCIVPLAAAIGWGLAALDAQAANKKPNNNNAKQAQQRQAQQRAAQQRAAQQRQQQQAALKAQQEAAKREQAEILAKFDTNKNGKIDGDEKPAVEKYLREKRLGKTGSSNAAKLTGKK